MLDDPRWPIACVTKGLGVHKLEFLVETRYGGYITARDEHSICDTRLETSPESLLET